MRNIHLKLILAVVVVVLISVDAFFMPTPVYKSSLSHSIHQSTTALSASTERRPLSKLLRALNERNVPYPAGASLEHLEYLLTQAEEEEKQSRRRQKKLPISELLDELDRRGIGYPPRGSRRQLEDLLHQDDILQEQQQVKVVKNTVQRKSRPTLRELLKELDRRGIQYPSRGSRRDLEILLKQDEHSSENDSTGEKSEQADGTTSDFEQPGQFRRVSINDPLEQSFGSPKMPEPQNKFRRSPENPLNDEDLSYRSTNSNSTRRRREGDGYRGRRGRRSDSRQDDENSPSRRHRRRQLALDELSSKSIWSQASSAVSRVVPKRAVDVGGKAVSLVGKKAKQAAEKAVKFITEDLDDDFEYEGNRDRESTARAEPERFVYAEPVEMNVNSENPKSTTGTSFPSEDTIAPDQPRRSITEIINDLEAAGAVFPADASRKDLEELLSSLKTNDGFTESESHRGHDDSDDSSQTWGDLLSEKVKSGSKKVRSAKRVVSNKFKKSPEQGDILDAVIEDFTADSTLIDVEAVVVPPRRRKTDVKMRNTRRTQRELRRKTPSKASRRHKRPRSQGSYAREPAYDGASVSLSPTRSVAPLPQLPASTDPSFNRFQQNSASRDYRVRKKHSKSQARQRRVYSPYASASPPEDVYLQDSFGRFFERIADTADAFLWEDSGNFYEDGSRKRRRDQSSEPSTSEERPSSQRRHRSSRGASRPHWRDRMEMNFDYFMGIHEDGKEYSRWMNEDLMDEVGEGERLDAVDYANGKKRRKSRVPKYERAIWENDSSLFSLLFGTKRHPGRREFLDVASDVSSPGSFLKLLRTFSRVTLTVGDVLGRWASVRGAIPQPIVMVSLIAVGLSARPGRRIASLVIALLSFRTLGELIHGYAFDDFEGKPDDNYYYGHDEELSFDHDEDGERGNYYYDDGEEEAPSAASSSSRREVEDG